MFRGQGDKGDKGDKGEKRGRNFYFFSSRLKLDSGSKEILLFSCRHPRIIWRP